MKWVIIKGVRYPMSVVSAFAAYNQYEGQLYYENGEAHAGPLNKIE